MGHVKRESAGNAVACVKSVRPSVRTTVCQLGFPHHPVILGAVCMYT